MPNREVTLSKKMEDRIIQEAKAFANDYVQDVILAANAPGLSLADFFETAIVRGVALALAPARRSPGSTDTAKLLRWAKHQAAFSTGQAMEAFGCGDRRSKALQVKVGRILRADGYQLKRVRLPYTREVVSLWARGDR